jgi:hypothetical protein
MRTILIGVVLLAASDLRAAEPTAPSAELPPGFVLGYNKDASDSIKGSCRPAEEGTIACDFTKVLFFPPDTKSADADEQKIVADARKDPENAKQGMAKTRDNREKAKDVVMGPKGRQQWNDLVKAAESGDTKRWAHALTESDRRACHLMVYTYTRKFHRIGVRKWLSEQAPEGPCQAVEVWELSSDDDSPLIWHARSTKVSFGNTEGLCAIVAKEKGEVTEWNLKGPKRYEPPCDFIAYFE